MSSTKEWIESNYGPIEISCQATVAGRLEIGIGDTIEEAIECLGKNLRERPFSTSLEEAIDLADTNERKDKP